MFRGTERGAMARPSEWQRLSEDEKARQTAYEATMAAHYDWMARAAPESPPPVTVEPKRQHAAMPATAMRALRRGSWEPSKLDIE